MSEHETVVPRRDFLKLVGIGVAGAAASSCMPSPPEKLVPYLNAPTDVLLGVPNWYASTCTECSNGCGILVKAREGRAIKIEGNPAHPVNQGGLCARGHAALQGLYDPDRLKSPMAKDGGAWKVMGWDEAIALAGQKLAAAKGQGVRLLTGHQTGSMAALTAEWAAAVGATRHMYEPFAHETLREANRRTFGVAAVPVYDFARARMILSFGADFLETWLNVTGNAKGFAAARAPGNGTHFMAVEPRLSLTGANADEWIAVKPGGELALVLGLVRAIVTGNLGSGGAAGIGDALSAYTPEVVEQQSGVKAEMVNEIARHFTSAKPSLAIAGGIATQSEQGVALAAAVNLLNSVAGNVGQTVRFDRTMNLDDLGSFADLQKLIADMGEGKVGALVVHGTNPVYSVPGWAGFPAAMEKVPFKMAIVTSMDETAEACDLVFPALHSLESLDDVEPARGVRSIVQPAMQKLPMFDARPAGDVLIAIAKGTGATTKWPDTYADYLKARWKSRLTGNWDDAWTKLLQDGGQFDEAPAATAVHWSGAPVFTAPQFKGSGDLALVLFPSPSLYDGRGANKAWLQELPDPTTKVTWGTWIELHPDTAAKLGVKTGDPVKLTSESGSIEAPAYVWRGVRPDVVAVPLGNGHTSYGRFAKTVGVNALALLTPAQDAASGALAYFGTRVQAARGAAPLQLSMTQYEKNQHDRRIAQVIPIAALMGGAAASDSSHAGHGAHANGAPAETEHRVYPMGEVPGKDTEPRTGPNAPAVPAHAVSAFELEDIGRRPRRDPIDVGSYKTAKHHWAMAIDLNRCTGCSACMVACSSENNVPTVGPAMQKRGRDMFWIRLDRFEEKIGGEGNKVDVRHVPMMCQQCNDAPCEIVCPVYATYHNPEGLNAQVYNRCVGTRYCSNNCPYKVRAFNFLDYSAPEKESFAFPEPYNWQLNPDVTVRSKGVMEKCTFCVQRILEGKGNARDENREVRDGDITPACAQSCPSEAIVFGDLMDPNSRVSKIARHDERRYWVLNELNTKPNVTYLKRVAWGEEPSA